jgi:S1-C subfamily serine protease
MRKTVVRFVFVLSMLSVGALGAIVLSQPIQQTRPAAAAAANGLPDLSTVAEQALKVSVSIASTVTQQVNDPWSRIFYGNLYQVPVSGSGVIVSKDGYVLTNRHVVGDGAGKIRVTLPDGVERAANIVGIDDVSDLAVVKVDGKNLPTLAWGDSSQLRVAQWVLAVGNPFQLSGTVTLGIVSTVSRPGSQVGTYSDFIQTDAAINPGNSGGALINARGELVGINTMIYSESGGNQGIGFAIPSNLAQQIMKELIDKGEVLRGTIGIASLRNIDADTSEANGLGRVDGVIIMALYRGSPAVRAGLQRYDIITKVNDQTVTDANQFLKVVYNAKIGSAVKLEVARGGRRANVDVAVVKLTGPR